MSDYLIGGFFVLGAIPANLNNRADSLDGKDERIVALDEKFENMDAKLNNLTELILSSRRSPHWQLWK